MFFFLVLLVIALIILVIFIKKKKKKRRPEPHRKENKVYLRPMDPVLSIDDDDLSLNYYSDYYGNPESYEWAAVPRSIQRPDFCARIIDEVVSITREYFPVVVGMFHFREKKNPQEEFYFEQLADQGCDHLVVIPLDKNARLIAVITNPIGKTSFSGMGSSFLIVKIKTCRHAWTV